MNRISLVVLFLKAQFSALVGGGVDYIIMVALVEWIRVHYTIGIVCGGIVGAVVNFLINRYWTFKTPQQYDASIGKQLFRFVLMVAGSICLKSLGTWTVVEGFGIDYRVGRIITDLVVSLGFNFVLQSFWVFKKQHNSVARK